LDFFAKPALLRAVGEKDLALSDAGRGLIENLPPTIGGVIALEEGRRDWGIMATRPTRMF
jgi:hypothetical protein